MIPITRHMTREWGAEEAFDRWVYKVTRSGESFRRIDLVDEGQVVIHWNGCTCSGVRRQSFATRELPPIPLEVLARMSGPVDELAPIPSAEDLGAIG